MLNHISEIIVFVLLLPVLMHIILPLGILAGWLVWKGLKLAIGEKGAEIVRAVGYASKEPSGRRPLHPGGSTS